MPCKRLWRLPSYYATLRVAEICPLTRAYLRSYTHFVRYGAEICLVSAFGAYRPLTNSPLRGLAMRSYTHFVRYGAEICLVSAKGAYRPLTNSPLRGLALRSLPIKLIPVRS
jgi:hypothetical protein